MLILAKGITSCLLAGCIALAAIFLCTADAQAGKMQSGSKPNGLPLSAMKVGITSQGRTASFRLYDTVAAKEFYAQLPLKLDLTNFRDAQWMFYPPKKLNVTAREAYHDGKKGELSYYAPWGDVFMLYKDFYAGDEMHRLGVGLSGIDDIAGMSGNAVIDKIGPTVSEEGAAMRFIVLASGQEIVFELNDSQAAKDLYAQLPLEIAVEDYGGKEKIFYPPQKLQTADTPLVKGATTGTLAYYAPWGDVVLFYGSFGSAAGLYELGSAISGGESIRGLSGKVRMEKAP